MPKPVAGARPIHKGVHRARRMVEPLVPDVGLLMVAPLEGGKPGVGWSSCLACFLMVEYWVKCA